MTGTIQPYRPVDQGDRNEILLPVVGGLQELIGGSPGLFIDRPGFIADAQPESLLGQAVQAIQRLNCRTWASRDKSNYSQVVNQGNAELCGPYLDSLGERPDPGGFEVPFEGGQCPVAYNINIQYTGVFGFCDNVVPISEVFALGAIGPFRVETSNAGTAGGGSQLCPGFSYTTIRLFGGDGQLVDQRGSGFGIRLGNLSFTRVDGLPDNCGNPPILFRPPNTVTPVTPIPPEITINLPGVGPVNVNVDLDPDGNPIICAPELEVCVTVDVGGDGDGGGGGGGGGSDPDAEVGDPIDNPPGGAGNGDDTGFGDPPEGRVWIGAFVQLLGDLVPFGQIPGDAAGQSALSAVVGNASLTVDDENSGIIRDTHRQIRSEWSSHLVPVIGLSITGIRVNVNPALGYRVYPVSVIDPSQAGEPENG